MSDDSKDPPSDLSTYLERILRARVYDVAVETPLEEASRLSLRLGNRVLLKREDLQPVFSFKIRGAYNKMASLTPEIRSRGVVAASAGNHAQGVALSAQKLGCSALIVMPTTTPSIKVSAVRRLQADVLLQGDTYDEAYLRAEAEAERTGRAFIHPYDDPDVIAGQGTVGMEILRQNSGRLDAIFVPVGGGGLIAGIASYVKRVRPEVRMVGVEPVDADGLRRALADGHRVRLEQVGMFADGVAVRQVGEEPFRLCQKFVDEVVVADTDDICAAIKDVFEDTRSILEPAGALSIAGLKRYVAERGEKGGVYVAVASGANMNFDRLGFVAERAELGEQREAIFAVTIPERPGSFKAFCRVIGPRNITEFNYRYDDPQSAHVFVGVRVADRSEAGALIACFQTAGLTALDLTDNETAKLHIRHLVGGRAASARDERLYRFEFPERPGALMNFLDRMNPGWNITLFHYRNNGGDTGRVLAGIQVPHRDRDVFSRFLSDLGYPSRDETDNAACRLFLGRDPIQ